jgi:mandelamide amidase
MRCLLDFLLLKPRVTPLLVVLMSARLCAADPLDGPRQQTNAIEKLPSHVAERFVASLSAVDALHAMASGSMNAEQYVSILIQRISSNPGLNAVIQMDPERVLAAARAADALRASGEAVGALTGLPILLKDSINTADLPTTGGTPALAEFQPEDNAAVLQSLLDAGAILLGKTNLHELSAGYTTTNAFTGATLNPYDFARIPGGSSGGNGAALAARFAPVAVGEDTAGSVRVPAALNGVTGFRPSSGRYSQDGVIPLATSLDTLGPMARTVEDLALLDSVITGAPMGLADIRLDGLRLGLPRAHFRELLDPGVEEALGKVFKRLQDAGVVLVEADIPQVGELTQQASLVLNLFEAPRGLSNYLEANNAGITVRELAAQVASQDVAFLLSLALAGAVSEEDYLTVAFGLLPILQSIYLEYVDRHNLDAVVFPTNAVPAPQVGEMSVSIDGVDMPVFDAYFRLGHYAPLVGAPTVSLPIGQLPGGLPVGGIDIAGRPGDDRRILAIGAAISRVLPRIRPPQKIRPLPVDD